MRIFCFGVTQAVVAAVLLSSPVVADVIGSRAALNALLGSGGTTEGFDNLTVDANDQYDPDNETTLDSTTIALILGDYVGGPGLVAPGVQFVSTGLIGWNGDGLFGLIGNSLVSNSVDSTIEILFNQPVNATGLDLEAYQGFGADIGDVAVLGPDQTTTIFESNDIALPDTAEPIFFGYQDTGGIGGLVVTQQNHLWSPVIDNVAFGGAAATSAPEPEAWLLAISGIALVALSTWMRRRKARRRVNTPSL